MFQSSEEDSRKCLSCLDEVSILFLESFKGVAKSFWRGSFRGVLKAFQGVFKKLLEGVSGVLYGCLKQTPKECVKEVIEVIEKDFSFWYL